MISYFPLFIGSPHIASKSSLRYLRLVLLRLLADTVPFLSSQDSERSSRSRHTTDMSHDEIGSCSNQFSATMEFQIQNT